MTRVKRGTTANKRRKKIIKLAKGFKWGRKAKYKAAKDALKHAWTHAFCDRKRKKRDFRQLW
ncbi:mitochondrial large ribosomal subunit protein bL20m, partial [Patescibacteria group bacterium]|nr:mitochondrial large ribosomal subunit protein bL20m [Patescibacteria group bacterium]